MEELGFDLLTASLRADASDLRSFAEALAVKLEDAIPDHTRVERRADRLFSRTRRVRRITVSVDDAAYVLEVDGGALAPIRETQVRGIVLKREELALDAWIDGLAHALAALAALSERSRMALERMLRE
jgi:hypothetical protein